jgi:pimeloyl-ACP methyl ester carboxylesterase
MSPAIRLGDPDERRTETRPAEPINRLGRGRVTVGGIETRATWANGKGVPTVLLHGWMDNADTWLEVLDLLAARALPAIAYDQPGFGVAPPLDGGSVLDQLVDFAARAVLHAAEQSGGPVIVAGNSLGGWTALRVAQHDDLPIAGVVAMAPAGIRMAPLFFTMDGIPAVSRLISLPAPVPEGVVRSVAGGLYRRLAFGDPASIDQSIIDRFTRFTVDRAVIRTRLDYAKRVRGDLADPFDPERIRAPVTVLWGDRDRLCIPDGADDIQALLPHARVELLEGIGHTPQIECPEVVADAIEALAGASR